LLKRERVEEISMMKLDWAELKGEGNKLQDFARAFINEMIAYNLKWKELPGKSNEINLKLKNQALLYGMFHATNEKGNLYYKAFVKDGRILLRIFLGGFIVIGIISLILLPVDLSLAGMFFLAVATNWFFIVGGILGVLSGTTKTKKNSCSIALKSAEAEIRSI